MTCVGLVFHPFGCSFSLVFVLACVRVCMRGFPHQVICTSDAWLYVLVPHNLTNKGIIDQRGVLIHGQHDVLISSALGCASLV